MIDEAVPLRELDRHTESGCHGCGKRLCGHEVLFSVALGQLDAPRCLPCLARGLDRPAAELRDDLWQHVRRRDCYLRAWQVAGEREGWVSDRPPPCLWTDDAMKRKTTAPTDTARAQAPPPAAFWDAGSMACGDLVLLLRGRLLALAPGEVLEVVAHDPGAPEDLPAWCRLTGHRLCLSQPPVFRIQRKRG